MNKRKLLVGIPIIFLLLNVVGYLIFTRGRTSSVPAPATTRTPPPPSPIVQARDIAPVGGSPEQKAGQSEEDEKKATAMTRRAAGLAALEAGNYDSALINFTEARALIGDKANVAELLRVTNDLRRSGKTAERPREPGPAREPVAPRPKARAAERRVTLRDEPAAPESNQVQAQPASGLLIVTTTPRGLLVQVDDVGIDLTPMRTKVRPGFHRVTLLDGDRKVYETTVDVKEGTTATLLKDLPPEAAPESPRATSPAAPAPLAAPVTARNDAPGSTSGSNATMAPSSSTRATTTPPASTASGVGTGALDVSSPGLYGVVWVNGRPRGYPPLVIRDLPVGKTKIEVRVNGIQKRSATIVVKPGSTTAVQLRSQESVL